MPDETTQAPAPAENTVAVASEPVAEIIVAENPAVAEPAITEVVGDTFVAPEVAESAVVEPVTTEVLTGTTAEPTVAEVAPVPAETEQAETFADIVDVPPAPVSTPEIVEQVNITQPAQEERVADDTPQVVETVVSVQTPLAQVPVVPMESTPPTSAPSQTPAVACAHIEPPAPQVKTIEKIVYATDPNFIKKLLNKASAKIQERKQKKLDKVMTLFDTLDKVGNKDVQKLLRATKRTSGRYLEQLEQKQKIRQIGEIGRGVLYAKKP